MKALISHSTDIEVILTDTELNKLKFKKISGIGEVREGYEGPNKTRTIEVIIGALRKNLFLEIKCYGPSYEEITGYTITISKYGYRILEEKGKVVDRVLGGSKVEVISQVESHLP